MKKLAVLLLITFCSFHGFSQILEPVKWSTAVHKTSDTEAILTATATIDSNWHLYSQTVPENGPIPTRFSFEGNASYLKKGNTKEGIGKTVLDPTFEMQVTYFEKQAIFKQRIKLKSKDAFKIKAIVLFMVCDDTRCLPPTEADLLFEIK